MSIAINIGWFDVDDDVNIGWIIWFDDSSIGWIIVNDIVVGGVNIWDGVGVIGFNIVQCFDDIGADMIRIVGGDISNIVSDIGLNIDGLDFIIGLNICANDVDIVDNILDIDGNIWIHKIIGFSLYLVVGAILKSGNIWDISKIFKLSDFAIVGRISKINFRFGNTFAISNFGRIRDFIQNRNFGNLSEIVIFRIFDAIGIFAKIPISDKIEKISISGIFRENVQPEKKSRRRDL